MVLFGGWAYTPTAGKTASLSGTGSAFAIDNNSSTHYSFTGSAATFSTIGSSFYDALLPNDWWHPVVGFAIVGISDGTASQSVRLNLGCDTTKTMSYWQPFMLYIPASAGFSQSEVLRWRAQLLHGGVPSNWNNPGMAVSVDPIAVPNYTYTTTYSAAGTALPSCAAGNKGQTAIVSDATTPTYLAAYASGGAVVSPVVCNGSGWVTY
jgi:hypothetical protein